MTEPRRPRRMVGRKIYVDDRPYQFGHDADFDAKVDKVFGLAIKGFKMWLVFTLIALVVTLAVLGLLGWAVVEIVQHVTAD